LSEAIFAWDKDDMSVLVAHLKSKLNLSYDEIQAWKYFRRRYFARRVKRACLPPSRLYWRVRAVLEFFGSKVDHDVGKPLFDKKTWASARGVLKEIISGHYTDPPDVALYKYELTESDEIKYDPILQIPLLECDRDTNLVENSHKYLKNTFGYHSMGIQFTDGLLAERRHRRNTRASIRNRSGFPNVGHYDPWLVDAMQNITDQKYKILLYPHWVNSSEFAGTEEKFGFVSLAEPDLEAAINELQIDPKLTPDMQFLADSTGLKIPPCPWAHTNELKLFPKLLRLAQRQFRKPDDIERSIGFGILKHVDGKTIFPKLRVHTRLYLKRYLFNSSVKDATATMAHEISALNALNDVTESIANFDQVDEIDKNEEEPNAANFIPVAEIDDVEMNAEPAAASSNHDQ
jgi:hypothetical protein